MGKNGQKKPKNAKKTHFSLNLFDANYNFKNSLNFCDTKICRPKVYLKKLIKKMN